MHHLHWAIWILHNSLWRLKTYSMGRVYEELFDRRKDQNDELLVSQIQQTHARLSVLM
jgi:hypothetical protein